MPASAQPLLTDSNNTVGTHSALDKAVETSLPQSSPSHSQSLVWNCCTSSLFPGSHFAGCQKSGRNAYDVQVQIQVFVITSPKDEALSSVLWPKKLTNKHVDLKDSFLCGYLNIKGLTEVCYFCTVETKNNSRKGLA